MFNVGDKVVYPMHGAGVIEAIEEQEILGERRKYYVLRMPIGDMKVMVPLDRVSAVGLRGVVDTETVHSVLEHMKTQEESESISWNRRYRTNLDKIRSGDIFDVADVVCSLMLRDGEKGLSTGERKMLENAKQILISELVLVKNWREDQAFEMIDDIFLTERN